MASCNNIDRLDLGRTMQSGIWHNHRQIGSGRTRQSGIWQNHGQIEQGRTRQAGITYKQAEWGLTGEAQADLSQARKQRETNVRQNSADKNSAKPRTREC